jgi:hypothetical protein
MNEMRLDLSQECVEETSWAFSAGGEVEDEEGFTSSPLGASDVGGSRSAGCLGGNTGKSEVVLFSPPDCPCSSSRYPISPRLGGNGPACCRTSCMAVVEDDATDDAMAECQWLSMDTS